MTNAGTGENDNQAEAPAILVVEDEVLIRLAVSDYLRDCGYRVVEAGSGDEAVTIQNLRTPLAIVAAGHRNFKLCVGFLRQRP